VALAPFVVGGIAVGGAAMGGVAVGFRAHGPSAVGLQVSHPETRLHSGRGPQAASPKPEPPWGGPKQSESSLKSPPLHPSQTVPGPVPLSGAP
jgi:hypothetical protein